MPSPAIRALEPRFVFDGAAAPAAAQAQSDAAAQSHGEGADTSHADSSHAEPADRQAAAPAAATPGTETASANGRHEIVVIDRGVADLQTLLAGVPASAEVILIDSGTDGFDQLADALEGRSGIDAIHILSHGTAGDLRLGTGDLTAETIQGRYAADLAIIGRALTATGDLLIYGCDFAAGETGARAAALLAQATGADVAASNDATGHADLGGDWDLEVHDGAIETGVAISEAAQRDWQHLLATAADNGRGALLAVSGHTIYSVDIATGKATAITTAPNSVGGITLGASLNSLAVDQANGLIYYVDNASPNAANKNALFAYDFRTDTHILIDADLSDNGVTTGTQGVGGAGAAFYNGVLYLAAEDVSGTTDRIYKLTFSNSGRTVASASTFGDLSTHDYNWGDITIDSINNQLISLTTASYARFDLTTGNLISFAATTRTDAQTGFDQSGRVYSVGANITELNPTDGTAAATGVKITTDGSTAIGAVNDAAAWTPPTSTISGRVFADANKNGTSDSGEGGLQGVTVQLIDDVNGNGQIDAGERVLATETSAADGSYSFTGLLPGDFIVRANDANGRIGTATPTTATSVPVHDGKVGATLTGPDFGYDPTPMLDLDASASGTGYTTSYTENGAGIAIVDTDVSVTDVDSTTMASARVVITNGSLGDRLSVAGTLPSNIGWTFDPATYTLALTGTATKADYQTALQQIRFLSTSDDPASTTRSIAVTVNDGALDSNIATTAVAFTAVNDAPVNGIPAAQTVNEDTDLVFATGNANRITVSDVDARGGSLTTTLSVRHGNLTLGGTANVTVSGNGTGTVTLSGTVADINNALNGTVYRAASDYNGADTLTMTTDDGGNTGSGGRMTDTDTVALTVVPVADPPRNTTPAGTQAATEDTSLVFSSTSGNGVSVTDVDGNGLTVTLSSTHGLLTLSRLTGLTFTAGDGTGDAAMTFSGSEADINAALEGLRFDPSADYNGSADIALVTRGPTRTADNFTNGGFENPVISTSTFELVPDSSVPGWKTDATDRDIEIWKSGYQGVTAYEGNQFAEINANQVAALFQTFDAAAGSKITLDFAHRGRQGVDTMQVLVTDLGADGVLGTADDAVLLDKTYADGNTAWGAYHEDLAQSASGNTLRFEFRSISAAGGSPSIGNFVDGIRIQQSFEVASNIHVAIAAVPDIVADTVATDEDTGITFNAVTGTNGASADNFEDPTRAVTAVTQGAHGRVTFQPDGTMTYTPEADFNGADSFTYTVTSGGTTETATVSVTVRPVNDAPVNALPAAQAVNEDTDLVFSTGNANRITVSDIDAGGGNLTTTLSVLHGTLTVGGTANVTVSGDGTGTLTLTGTAADINAALDGTTYRGSPNYNGAETLSVATSDNGNTGSGGPRTDTDALAITVAAVNDAPVNGLPAAQAVDEDADLVFSAGRGNPITVSDIDANGGSLTTTLSVLHGTLTLGGTANVTVSGNGTGSLTLTGTIAAINAALDGTTYRGSADYNGPDTLTIATDDRGNSGAGGAKSDTDLLALTVRPVEDAPTNAVPAATQAIAEDMPLVFSAGAGNGISVADPDGGTLTVTLSSAQGRLTLSRITGLTFLQGDGSGDGTMRFSGAIADINAALDGLRFDPNPDLNGPAQIALTTQDPEGATASSTIAVSIAPVADIVPDAVATDEDSAITFNALTGTNGASPDNFEDPARAVTAVTQGAHGRVTFQPDGTMTYTPEADFNGNDSFTYTVTSGGTTETATVTVTVRAVNDAPVLDLAAGAGTGYATSYTERTPGVAIVDADVSVVDVDDAGMASAKAVITNGRTGDTLAVAGALPAGITANFDAATYTLSLTGAASKADYQTALRQIRFSSAERDPATDTRSIAVSVNDGRLDSNVATTTVTFAAVNDAPVNGMPADQGVAEDTPLVFSAANGNRIGVSDADAKNGAVTTTLSVLHGTLTLGSTSGVTVAGNGTGSVTLTGTVNAINTALDGTTYRPAADYNGADTLTVLTNDNGNTGSGGARTDTDAITLIIAPVNDAPRAGILPAIGSLDGDTVANADLGRYFSDVEGDTLRFTGVGLPPGLAIDPATGLVSGTIDRSASRGGVAGDYAVTITAEDGNGGVTSRIFVWRVVDPAPIARNDAVVVDAATPATGSVLADNGNGPDGDPDGDPLSVAAVNGSAAGVGQPVAGSAGGRFTVLADGRYHFDPGSDFTDLAPGETRTTRITYTLSDGDGGTAEASVAVTVTGRDAPPAALAPGDRAAADGQSVALPLGSLFADPDGRGLRFGATGLPPGLSIDPATGIVTGTIDHAASGATGLADYRITIVATDPQGATSERSFTFRVTNPPPRAADDRATTVEDMPVAIDVLANDRDPDGDTLAIVATGDAAPSAGHGRVAVTGGRLVYTPDPNFNGADTITYTIADGNGGTSTASVTVTVSPADDAPSAGTLPDQFGRDGAPVRYDVSSRFHDADTDPSVVQAPTGDSLSFTATGLPPGLSIDPATGLITGTLPSDASAASRYAVTITATDAAGAAVTRGFVWTVSNGAPLAAPDTATTREGTTVLTTVTANDLDPDGDAIRLVDEPGAASAAHGSVTVDPATGLLAYTPEAGFTGRDTIVYTIADAQGARATGILTVTVTAVNDRPVAAETLPGRNAADGESVRVPLGNLIADPDGDRLAYTVTGLPPGLSIDPATGEIAGTIDHAASGPSGRATYVVTLTATDPGGLAVSRSFAWTVTNPAPTAADDAIATAEDTPVDIDVTGNDADPDGDALTVVPGSMAAGHGTVTLNPDGSLRYVPDRDFNGTDRIVYTITDGNGGFATASATITVTPVNDAPTVDPSSPALVDRSANDAQTVSIPAGGAFGDVDAGDRLSFGATGLPPGLTIDPATGLIAGTIASDASSRAPGGVYTVVLTATDTGGASVTTRFTITVANPAPIAVDDAATLAEDGVLTGSVLGNDRDPDGDALRVDPVPVAGPAHGRLDLRPDGTFTYSPDADFHGADAFTYALIDSDGGRATATVHLTVESVNDAPTATADPLTLPANTVGTGRIAAEDRDGDALSFRLTEQPVNGTVTLAADGSYAYKPYAAFSGADSFVVEVGDGHGGTTLVTVAITITPNPVQVPPSALVPILSPPQPFPDRPAAPPVLPSASAISANGIVLPAVSEIDALGSVGDVILADGAVVVAVNGVASLHGTMILVDHPVVLDESDRIARLAWERFERVPIDETPWFSPRPYLGRSLGVSLTADATGFGTNDLMVEAIRRPDTLAINLRNYTPGLDAVAVVRLLGVDGAPRPDWIEGDGKGGFWGRPPAGTGLVRIELEIEMEDGRVVRRPLSVDAETGEIRALPPARPAGDTRPLGVRDPEPAPRPEAPLFTTQLASLGGRAGSDLALIEKALARGMRA